MALRDDTNTTPPRGSRQVPRKQIIRKAMDFVDQRVGERMSVQEIDTAAGVSERTLRSAFPEYFSTGRVWFLKLKTLRDARITVIDSDCWMTIVAEIATSFGVRGFRCFAHYYRMLFGTSACSKRYSML